MAAVSMKKNTDPRKKAPERFTDALTIARETGLLKGGPYPTCAGANAECPGGQGESPKRHSF
jgi:hypothetical protein